MGSLGAPRSRVRKLRLAVSATIALFTAGQAGGNDLAATINAILSEPTVSDDARLARFEALPRTALPILFGLVETGHFRSTADTPRRLTEGQEAAVLAGLRAYGPDAVHSYVAGRLKEDPGIATRVAALRALGATGGAGELPLAVSAAVRSGDRGTQFSRIVEAFTQAVGEILRRDPRALRSIDFVIRDTPAPFRYYLVNAVGATESAAGLEPLTYLLGDDPRLDVVLLTQIARLGRLAAPPIDSAILESVREYLWAEDAQLLREAAHVAGVLEDFDAMERLIELVDDERAPIRESSNWALRRMTGLALRADARLWRSWYSAESRWYREDAPALVGNLRHEAEGNVVSALSELARHKLHRHRLASEIEIVLDDDRACVRRLGCFALRQLGSLVAVPALTRCLLDADDSVVLEASRALRALTGADALPDLDSGR